MEKIFTGLITTLSIPILLLNFLGGIIGGIWLMIAGEWSLFIGGLAYMAFSAMLLGILLLPSLLLGGSAGFFAGKRNYFLFFLFGLLSLAYIYILIAFSTYLVSGWVLSYTSAPLWACLLWLYAVVLAPWQYMASKEQDNSAAGITTFILALGLIAIIIAIGVFNMSLGQSFSIFSAILTLGVLSQLAITMIMAMAMSKSTENDEIIDIEPENKRKWEDVA
jgi:hypothetical protein